MLKRNVGDDRRTIELEKRLGTMKKFGSAPALGQLRDGESGIVKGTGQVQVFVREGDKLYVSTFTEVT